MNGLMTFLRELKRRNVFKVAVGYLALGWVLIEVSSVVLPTFQGPPWVFPTFTFLVAIGFPVAIFLAWSYELSPSGIEKQSDLDARSAPPSADSALAAVAVFPFRNLTSESAHGFLADSIPIELQNSLARMHQLRVVSGQSSSVYGGSERDLPSIADALKVQYVISGSIAEVGQKIRITATVDDAANDSMLWSDSFDAEVDDVFSVQQRIAESIVGAFGGERLRAEISRQRDTESVNLAAWELLQKARSYLLNYNANTVVEAIPLIERALELDPGYAEGHAALGLAIAEKTLNGASEDAETDREKALESVARALQISPQDPVVLRAAGPVYAFTGDYRRALELLRRSVSISPFDFGAWGYLGWPLIAIGTEAAFTELHGILDKLLTTAPKHPGSAYWKFHKSVLHSCEGEYRRARPFAEETTLEQPHYALAWMNYANVLGCLGEPDTARRAIESCLLVNPKMTPEYYVELMGILSDQPRVIESRTRGVSMIAKDL